MRDGGALPRDRLDPPVMATTCTRGHAPIEGGRRGPRPRCGAAMGSQSRPRTDHVGRHPQAASWGTHTDRQRPRCRGQRRRPHHLPDAGYPADPIRGRRAPRARRSRPSDPTPRTNRNCPSICSPPPRWSATSPTSAPTSASCTMPSTPAMTLTDVRAEISQAC